MSNPHSTAAAYLRRLHAKVAERDLDDRTDAWIAQLALLGEDVIGGLTPYLAQERLSTLLRLANRTD